MKRHIRATALTVCAAALLLHAAAASARATELTKRAQADRLRQSVLALGGPAAYNNFVFAEGLPEDMKVGIFYAGAGTFWTDLKGFEQTLLGKLAAGPDAAARNPAPSATAPRLSAGP